MIELQTTKEVILIKEDTLLEEVVENMEHMVRVMDKDHNVVYMNKKMRSEFGDFTHKKCYELLGRNGYCLECVSVMCRQSGQAESKGVLYGDKYYKIIASPVTLNKSGSYAIELFQDITLEHRQEEEIRIQYQKMKEDIEFAKQIQSRSLPSSGNYWGTIIFDAAYQPSEDLGGDMFDLIKLDEDKILIYIADISGHGIRSSLLTMFLRQTIRGMRTTTTDLNDMLNEIIKNYNELNLGDEQYFSLLLGLYGIGKKEWRFVNAGHNCLPVLIKKEGGIEEIKISGMPICSLLKEAKHEQKTLKAGRGDKVLFYTDGITEAYNLENERYFGEERMMSFIEEHAQKKGNFIVTEIIKNANDFAGTILADDAAVFVVEIL